jgi:hypothetical protein
VVGWDWVHLVRRLITGLLYQPRLIDDECGTVDGIKIGRGSRCTQRKPTPMPLCPPQIPYDLTWDRTRAVSVGSRRLTAWAMARPYICVRLRLNADVIPVNKRNNAQRLRVCLQLKSCRVQIPIGIINIQVEHFMSSLSQQTNKIRA